MLSFLRFAMAVVFVFCCWMVVVADGAAISSSRSTITTIIATPRDTRTTSSTTKTTTRTTSLRSTNTSTSTRTSLSTKVMTTTSAIPTSSSSSSSPSLSSCTAPAKRLEWRTLSKQQKSDYISSVKCLMTKPSRTGFLKTSLYEDFAYVHAHLNTEIHFVAQFLPWHRYFTHAFEQALRKDCKYTGPMPYWDWVQDNASPSTSPIWSATDGFGGNGNGTGFQNPARPGPLIRCVTDGPFQSFRPTYRDTNVEPHCLNRAWNDGIGSNGVGRMQGAQYTPSIMSEIINTKSTFVDFWQALENGPHGAIHQGISGDMGPSTSPNDPIFFLHHAQIDRVWWLWQQQNPKERSTTAYGGNKAAYDDSAKATLDDILPMMNLISDIKVRQVMSTTSGGPLCYTY